MKDLSNKIGIGCKDFSTDTMVESNEQLIKYAIDLGIVHINTADFYQAGKGQLFLREALKEIPRNTFEISVKFGGLSQKNGKLYGIDINPFNIYGHLVQSLNTVNLDYVDILIPARIDEAYPVEDIISEMGKLVKEGLVKHLGLTMIDADTLRRAHKIYPIYCIEMEYNILNREIENELIKTAHELGVKIITFGTLTHGLLSERIFDGTYDSKYSSDIICKVKKLVLYLQEVALSKNTTLTGLLYAYIFNKHPDFLVLSGTTNKTHFDEIISGLHVKLSEEEIKSMEDYIDSLHITLPSRYPKYRNGRPII